MKRNFTKLFSAVALLAFSTIGFAANAQTTLASAVAKTKKADTTMANEPAATTKAVKKETKAADADTAWHPQRRVWGYSFGDLYFDQHADQGLGTRGAESAFAGVPSNRNAFLLRRIYLGYDYEINKRFKAELLLASEPNANTGTVGVTSTSTTTITGATGVTGKTTTTSTTTVSNGDNLVDNKMSFFIKNINLRYRELYPGGDLVVGEMATPGFALNEPGTNGPTTLSETVWAYRSVERTITDFHKNNSYDLGAALQGTFDPSTKNFGYVLMVANNSTSSLLGAANPNTGFYKIFYGDIWTKFAGGKVVFDLYADYAQTAPTGTTPLSATTPVLGSQEHNMVKLFGAYTTPVFTLGVEAYTQKIGNGVTNNTTHLGEDATVNAISIFVRGAITKGKLGYFARFDAYQPDTKYNGADAYTVNTNYGSYTPIVKENFYTAGLDFTPAKNVHFMPNLWLLTFKDNRDATTAGYVAADHTLVYRATFYYVFGK